jgi:Glycosyl hydrolase family 65, N-terminal domain
VTNGKLIRLFVDDEPFDVRYGELRSHERLLDFRAGVLNRRAERVSPAGRRIRALLDKSQVGRPSGLAPGRTRSEGLEPGVQEAEFWSGCSLSCGPPKPAPGGPISMLPSSSRPSST